MNKQQYTCFDILVPYKPWNPLTSALTAIASFPSGVNMTYVNYTTLVINAAKASRALQKENN